MHGHQHDEFHVSPLIYFRSLLCNRIPGLASLGRHGGYARGRYLRPRAWTLSWRDAFEAASLHGNTLRVAARGSLIFGEPAGAACEPGRVLRRLLFGKALSAPRQTVAFGAGSIRGGR